MAGRVPSEPGAIACGDEAQEVSAHSGNAPSREARAWPLGGYAPGNYFCKCFKCGVEFEGDKRAIVCLECAAGDIKFHLALKNTEAFAWRNWFDERQRALDELIHAASVFWGAGSEQHNLVRDVAAAVLKDAPRDRDAAPRGREAAEAEGQQPGPNADSASPETSLSTPSQSASHGESMRDD